MGFFAELKRRNVVRVGVAYVVIAWLLAQIAEFAFENFGAPEWVLKSFVVVLLLGLPLALLFAWAFEMTPEGLKLERDVDRTESITPQTGRKIDRLIIATLAVALAYFIWHGRSVDESPDSAEPAAVAEQQPVGPSERSIAVLPFVNMSSDQEQEWFADGLTEELLNSLARMPELLVAARTSSFAYKGSNESVPVIARELGVAHVLEGSVRRGKDRVRITAQLIRAVDGFHLWSETYDRSLDDVIAIQEELAIKIAGAMEIALDPDALADMVTSGTASVPAYEAYLEGLAIAARRNQSGDVEMALPAKAAYERAVEIDPEFYGAHVELAWFWSGEMTFNNIGSQLLDMEPGDKLANFKRHIRAAIDTTTDEVGIDHLRAWDAVVDLRFNEADDLLQRYVDARPNDSEAAQSLVNIRMRQGRFDEALEQLGFAVELNRDDPQPLNWLIATHVFAGDYQGASDVARRSLREHPDNALLIYQAHRAFIWNGEYDAARKLIPSLEASQLPWASKGFATLRQACADGDEATARGVMTEMEERYDDDTLWIPYHLTGQLEKVEAIMRPIHDTGQLYALSEFLNYPYFDPNPYPELMKVLQREGIDRPEPIEIPFACQL